MWGYIVFVAATVLWGHSVRRHGLTLQTQVPMPIAVALITFPIGVLFGAGFSMSTGHEVVYSGSLWAMILAFFHWSEFVTQALYRSDSIELSSFHLNHSKEYKLMMVVSWVEYLLESYVYPDIKQVGIIASFGFIVCMTGLGFRIVAMVQCAENFSHIIEDDKRENHKLVTNGVYSLVRHPSYAGFAWFAVGSQVLMLNPICIVLFAGGCYEFFKDRIPYEEAAMMRKDYFGKAYKDYKKKVPSGVPFVEWLD